MGEDGRRRMPPSLTSEELRAIQAWERTHRSPAVRRLLWEVFRLRIIVRRAAQVAEMLGDPRRHPPPLDTMLIALHEELKGLPFLEEELRRQDRILYGHGQTKRKGVNNA
jgi:hypothetical protein